MWCHANHIHRWWEWVGRKAGQSYLFSCQFSNLHLFLDWCQIRNLTFMSLLSFQEPYQNLVQDCFYLFK